jgi:dimethylargininase
VVQPGEDDAPDGVFVEDTAVLLGEHAVMACPGGSALTTETASTAAVLGRRYSLHQLLAGTPEGGDILKIARALYVGLSARTDRAGAEALRTAAAEQLGCAAEPVAVRGCLLPELGATLAGHGAGGAPVLVVNPEGRIAILRTR